MVQVNTQCRPEVETCFGVRVGEGRGTGRGRVVEFDEYDDMYPKVKSERPKVIRVEVINEEGKVGKGGERERVLWIEGRQ